MYVRKCTEKSKREISTSREGRELKPDSTLNVTGYLIIVYSVGASEFYTNVPSRKRNRGNCSSAPFEKDPSTTGKSDLDGFTYVHLV